VVFGDAERPANLCALRLGIVVRKLPDQIRRHPCLAGGNFQRPRLGCGDVVFEAGGGVFNERFVDQPGVNDLAANTVGQRDIGADVETEPSVGPLGRLRPARIDGIDLGPFVNRFQGVMKENRMRFAGIGAPEDEQIRIFSFAVGRGATASSEYRHQTGDARSVSSSITGIDVIGADHRPSELLGDEVHLVGRARA
jgi:hypothetical protein